MADWKASGLTAAAYAQPRGWSPSTLKWWSSQLNRQEVAAEASMRFVRLVAAPAPTPPPSPSPPAMLLELGDARLVLPPGFDRDDLAVVLDLVRAGGRQA